MRWAWAEIDHAAIAHNVAVIRSRVEPSAVLAVVKADAYGHGAVAVARRTALAAGAAGLCVALAQEGAELRAAGVDAPILVLTQQPDEELPTVVEHRLTATVYTPGGINALADAVGRADLDAYPVHLKLDTGMHRAGADPEQAASLAAAIAERSELSLEGVFTHLAVADQPDAASNDIQMQRFAKALDALQNAGHRPAVTHIANSAAAVAIDTSRGDVVRLGISMYGIEPGPGVSHLHADLRPAMSLHARVSLVRQVRAGEGISYGLRHTFPRDTTVATVPIGYADGVPRRLFDVGGEVLIDGCRRPIVGVVTMDQLMVDCGDLPVSEGDEVVLLGRQSGRSGADEVRAEEWAARLGTIGYEIVCGISKRIERRHLLDHPSERTS